MPAAATMTSFRARIGRQFDWVSDYYERDCEVRRGVEQDDFWPAGGWAARAATGGGPGSSGQVVGASRPGRACGALGRTLAASGAIGRSSPPPAVDPSSAPRLGDSGSQARRCLHLALLGQRRYPLWPRHGESHAMGLISILQLNLQDRGCEVSLPVGALCVPV